MKFIKGLVFIDIETVTEKQYLSDLPDKIQWLWNKKAQYLLNENDYSSADLYEKKAAIYSEFGKVVVISLGMFYSDQDDNLNLRIKSLFNHNEKELLEELKTTLNQKTNEFEVVFCAHNGKEFDFPYLARRMVVNQITLPEYLRLSGKKPWEIEHVDTLEMWKFGDRKSFTSLELLTTILEIPSPKEDMDGSMVSYVYYEENDLGKIAKYCNRDVEATAQLFLRLKGFDILPTERIHYVN